MSKSGRNVLGAYSFTSLHMERADIFSAVRIISCLPFLALERRSLHYHPQLPGAVQQREGRVHIKTGCQDPICYSGLLLNTKNFILRSQGSCYRFQDLLHWRGRGGMFFDISKASAKKKM